MCVLVETIVDEQEVDQGVEEVWHGVLEEGEERWNGRYDWEEDIEEECERCYEEMEEPKRIDGKGCWGADGQAGCGRDVWFAEL